ncbi:MAG: hypothetical protein EA397_20560, partial [Deltaproteobacteria bacterium]
PRPGSQLLADVKRLPQSVQDVLPAGLEPVAVEPFAPYRRAGTYTLKYEAQADFVLAGVEARCAGHGSCLTLSSTNGLIMVVTSKYSTVNVLSADVTAEGEGATLAVMHGFDVGSLELADGGGCGRGRYPGVHRSADGTVEHTCYDIRGGRDGAYRLVRRGVDVLSGSYEKGVRIGEWVARRSDGTVVSRGPFEAGEPHGAWLVAGERVVFEKGVPAKPVPWVALRGDRSLSTPVSSWSFEVLDADLIAGTVGIRWVYQAGIGDVEARECRYPGLASPTQGVRLALLEPGYREPLGVWTVYASALDYEDESEPCTADAEARAALDAAKRAFAMRELDTSKRTPLVPLVDGELRVGARTLRVDRHFDELTDDKAMRYADTVHGGWEAHPASRVGGFRVTIDGVEVHAPIYRADATCAGLVEINVAGAIVQGDRVALVWSGERSGCKATVPFVLVGPVW